MSLGYSYLSGVLRNPGADRIHDLRYGVIPGKPLPCRRFSLRRKTRSLLGPIAQTSECRTKAGDVTGVDEQGLAAIGELRRDRARSRRDDRDSRCEVLGELERRIVEL